MSNKTKPIHASANMAREKAAAQDDNENENDPNDKERRKMITKTSPWVYAALVLFAVITYATMPDPLQPPHGEAPSIQHVFYYGWLTAISTGLGAIPLVFAPNLASYWVGISNGTLHYVILYYIILPCVLVTLNFERSLYCIVLYCIVLFLLKHCMIKSNVM